MSFARSAEQVEAYRLRATKRREPNGRAQRSTTTVERADDRARIEFKSKEEAQSMALSQPHRRSLPKRRRDEEGRIRQIDPTDPMAGYTLGRLYLSNAISRDQYVAGMKYAELSIRHMQHITGHSPKFPSQAINDTVKGLACTADLPDDEVFALRRSWNDAQRALIDTCEWSACASALTAVCVMDREVRGEAQMGALRVGLNALHRLWR